MCTSFIYRKETVLVGMNFDNDGKDFKISPARGGDFLVSVSVGGAFFPSFGINRGGVFVNDLMVDSNGAGQYKRQNDSRWVTSALVRFIMDTGASLEDIRQVLGRVEIVNAPRSSTHQLIADRQGSSCVVEPGRKIIFTTPRDSGWYAMTNFPLSDYAEALPAQVKGGGAERYLKLLSAAAALDGPMTVERGFELLKTVRQDGPAWRTELSLVYDGTNHALFYALDQDFDRLLKYDFDAQNVTHKKHT